MKRRANEGHTVDEKLLNTLSVQMEVDLSAKIDELAHELQLIAALVNGPEEARQPRKVGASTRKAAKKRNQRQTPTLRDGLDVFDPDRCNFPALIGLLDEVTQKGGGVKPRRARS